MRIPLLRIPSFSPVSSFSSEARNLPCTPLKRRLRDNDETKNRRFLRFLTNAGAATTLRSLGSAFDDDTGKRTISQSPFIPSRRRLPLRGRSILRLRRAPSSRGYSTGMQKRNLRESSKTRNMRIPFSPYRHFERSEKSSLHTGKAETVR